MAIDKAVDSSVLDAGLTTVANAIRAKGGTSAQLSFPAGMAQAIADIEAGGGGDYDITVEADGDGQILHITDAQGGGGIRTTSGTWTPVVDNSNISIAHNAGYSKYVMVIEAASLAEIIASGDVYTAVATVYWETGMSGSMAARRSYNGADQAWSTSASGMVASGGDANNSGNITASAHLGTTYTWTVYDLGGIYGD